MNNHVPDAIDAHERNGHHVRRSDVDGGHGGGAEVHPNDVAAIATGAPRPLSGAEMDELGW